MLYEVITYALKMQYNLPLEECQTLAKLANGNYVAAKEIVSESEERVYFFDMFVNLMRLAYGRKLHELIAWSDEMGAQTRERQKSFLNYTLRMVRENFIMNMNEERLLYLVITSYSIHYTKLYEY